MIIFSISRKSSVTDQGLNFGSWDMYLFVFIDAFIIHLFVRGSNTSMLPKCSFPSCPPTAQTLPEHINIFRNRYCLAIFHLSFMQYLPTWRQKAQRLTFSNVFSIRILTSMDFIFLNAVFNQKSALMWTVIQTLRVCRKKKILLSTAGQIIFGHFYQSHQIFQGVVGETAVLLQQHRGYYVQGKIAS